MTELVRYDAACRAIAEAHAVDEVKDIRDKAIALAAYARQAKNHDLEKKAAQLRLRAERRVGELMGQQRETVGLNKGAMGRGVRGNSDPAPTLAEIGVDKNLAKKARELAAMPAPEFEELIEETGKAVAKAATSVLSQKTKKSRREQKLQSLASKALPKGQFVLVVLDPAWREEPWSRETGLNKAADNHYPTQTPAEIAALKPQLARDAIVYMWTTTSMMRIAIEILEGWDLTYKSQMVWVKERPGRQMGTGRWSRVDHEVVLVFTQGRPPAPADGGKISSVIYALVGEHSVKPDAFFAMLESNYPTVPKLEMYARRKRTGWTVWGNEVEDT